MAKTLAGNFNHATTDIHLNDIVKKNKLSTKAYPWRGVFGLHEDFPLKVGSYVCLSGDQTGHYCLLILKKNKRFVWFDSFGMEPWTYIQNKLQGWSGSYNRHQFQAYNSSLCGLFCMYFLKAFLDKCHFDLKSKTEAERGSNQEKIRDELGIPD